MRETCDEVLDELGVEDDPYSDRRKLEEIALDDDYFIEPQPVSERRLLLRHHS